jgi:membrane protease subunit (stomatin/prohibitin family)
MTNDGAATDGSEQIRTDGGVDVNRCDCGWSEVGENANPHRKKCPNCGAQFVLSETIRWFGR